MLNYLQKLIGISPSVTLIGRHGFSVPFATRKLTLKSQSNIDNCFLESAKS
jgi:hypothetical protein